jgi:hypothetical protein
MFPSAVRAGQKQEQRFARLARHGGAEIAVLRVVSLTPSLQQSPKYFLFPSQCARQAVNGYVMLTIGYLQRKA